MANEIQCKNCGRLTSSEISICGWCGRLIAFDSGKSTSQSDEDSIRAVDLFLAHKSLEGWKIVRRTPTSFYIKRTDNIWGNLIKYGSLFVLLLLLFGVKIHPLIVACVVVLSIIRSASKDTEIEIAEKEYQEYISKTISDHNK